MANDELSVQRRFRERMDEYLASLDDEELIHNSDSYLTERFTQWMEEQHPEELGELSHYLKVRLVTAEFDRAKAERT